MCVFSCQQSTDGWKSIFHECGENMIKPFPDFFKSVFEGAVFKNLHCWKKYALRDFQKWLKIG